MAKEFSQFTAVFATNSAQRWLGRIELSVLQELLRPGEKVEQLASAKVLVTTQPSVRAWLIALTNTRLLCIKGGTLHARRVLDLPHQAIVSVSRVNRILSSEVIVATAHGRVRISLPRSQAVALAEGLIARHSAQFVAPADLSLIGDPRADEPLPGPRDRSRIDQLEETVDQLEQELSAVRQQVDFLEELLKGKAAVLMP